jgi:hypothetical protein
MWEVFFGAEQAKTQAAVPNSLFDDDAAVSSGVTLESHHLTIALWAEWGKHKNTDHNGSSSGSTRLKWQNMLKNRQAWVRVWFAMKCQFWQRGHRNKLIAAFLLLAGLLFLMCDSVPNNALVNQKQQTHEKCSESGAALDFVQFWMLSIGCRF